MAIFNSYNLTEFNSLFEIPVYRLDPDSFENELQRELNRRCNPLTTFENLFPKNSKEKYDAHRHDLELHIGYPWKFNEIIGFVLLKTLTEKFLVVKFFIKKEKELQKVQKAKLIIKGRLSDLTS